MIGWLKNKLGGGSAIDNARNNPVLHASVQKSAEIYEQIPLRDFIDSDRREELARALYREIHYICNAQEPGMECREHIAEAMLEFAQYQVLVIPPEPEEDISGLRAHPGISGELRAHIVALCARSENLRTDLFGVTDTDSYESVWQVVQTNYWIACWRLESINATRIELGDHVVGADWYKPFMHASCASAEHVYRHNLELPPALAEDIAKPVSTAYSIYTDIVVSGAADPDGEWRDYYKDSNIPVPHFEL